MRLAPALQERVSAALDDARTTAELWRRISDLGPPSPGEAPLDQALRTALRSELKRREERDLERLYALLEEAAITGELRPYWDAREVFAQTSPDVTGRLFPLEQERDDEEFPVSDPEVTEEAYRHARAIIRARIAEIEEAAPTGANLALALAIVEEAITREESPLQKPLLYAMQAERRRKARSERNLLRSRLALALCEGRDYASFAENRSALADLSAEDWTRVFTPPGSGQFTPRPREASVRRVQPSLPRPPEPPAAAAKPQMHMIRGVDKDVEVTVPEDGGALAEGASSPAEVEESASIQAVVARVGARMGMQIWVPAADRAAVLAAWSGEAPTLLERLPLNYDETTMRTLEQIDVIWLRGRSIRRAFAVEGPASAYSGISRIADLLALQPNIDVRLHVLAPDQARERVMSEIRRPVFSLLDRGPLSESCSFLSFASVRALADLPHLAHLSDTVLEEYAEAVTE